MKYVIKNCDNYTEFDKDWTCRSTIQNRKGCYCCQDCTDCVLKQIVGLCRKTIKIFSAESGTNPYAGGRCTEAESILQLLDIQECK